MANYIRVRRDLTIISEIDPYGSTRSALNFLNCEWRNGDRNGRATKVAQKDDRG